MSSFREHETVSRVAIVQEAYEWLSTPFLDCARVKGKNGGVDCAQLLIGVYKAVGILDVNFEPEQYSPTWHIHHREERYRETLESLGILKRTSTPGLGDIALYRLGRCASHASIVVSADLMIHAYKPNEMVELRERSYLAQRLDSYWTCFA